MKIGNLHQIRGRKYKDVKSMKKCVISAVQAGNVQLVNSLICSNLVNASSDVTNTQWLLRLNLLMLRMGRRC